MKTFEVILKTTDNSKKSVFWMHKPWYQNMRTTVRGAIVESEEKSEESGSTWSVDSIKKIN